MPIQSIEDLKASMRTGMRITEAKIDNLIDTLRDVPMSVISDLAAYLNSLETRVTNRANHTGTQTASTVSNFNSAASAAAPVQSVNGQTGTVTLTIPSASTVAVNAPLTNSGTSTAANISVSAATTSAAGSMSAADKTKLNSIAEEQRAIVTVAGGAGRVTWTFPAAYGSGVIPIIQAQAVKPTGATVSYNCAILGDPSNTSVTIEANTVNPTIIGILGSILVAQPAPNGTKVHIVAKAP